MRVEGAATSAHAFNRLRDIALPVFLATETLAVMLYAWQSFAWYGWKAVGPDAFPGSPDAIYNYRIAERWSGWLEGVVVGLLIGAIAFCLARSGQVSQPTWPQKLAMHSTWILPLAALLAVNVSFLRQVLP